MLFMFIISDKDFIIRGLKLNDNKYNFDNVPQGIYNIYGYDANDVLATFSSKDL
jgi:hypothetical protein